MCLCLVVLRSGKGLKVWGLGLSDFDDRWMRKVLKSGGIGCEGVLRDMGRVLEWAEEMVKEIKAVQVLLNEALYRSAERVVDRVVSVGYDSSYDEDKAFEALKWELDGLGAGMSECISWIESGILSLSAFGSWLNKFASRMSDDYMAFDDVIFLS